MGKYLYCLIKNPAKKSRTKKSRTDCKFGIKGMEGKDIYTISEGDLLAVVSDSEVKEYLASKENLITHQKVIEEIFKKHNLLPVSFGTVVESEEKLKQVLKSKAKQLLTALEETEGKIELSLKGLWKDMGLIYKEIAKNPQIQNLKRSKISMEQRISAGKLVENLLNQKKEREKEKILTPLKRIANDFKEKENFGDAVIFNAVFLVKKIKEKEFDETVNAFGKKYENRIKFVYVGPQPPYNFIDIKVKI